MARLRLKISVLVVSAVLVGTAIVLAFLNHRELNVRKTAGGWVCDGPIEFEYRPAITRPVVCGENLVAVERYRRWKYREGLMIRSVKMGIPRDIYYITSLRLEDGRGVYRRRMKVKGFPLQVVGLWPWGQKAVVWGFHQGRSSTKRFSWVVILDANGEIIRRFAVTLPLQVLAIDQKNDLLLCLQIWDEKVFRKQKDPYAVVGLDLASGTVDFSVPAPLAFDMVADENGNAYVMRKLKEGGVDDIGVYDRLLEKYSVVPWKNLWSVTIEGTKTSYTWSLLYQHRLLWYALYEYRGRWQDEVEDMIRWKVSPITPDTGEKIEVEERCSPYRMETEVEGRKYTITRDGQGIRVKVDRE
jgi:hypothetical protein